MFQIKKSVFLALTLALLIALSACTETQPQVAASGRTSGTEVSSADLFPSSPLAEEPPATALAESSGETSDTQGTPPSNLPPSSPNEKPQTTVPSEPPKQTIDTPETPSTDNGPTQDQTTSSPDYEITVNENGTLTIKRYVGPGGDVVIPSEIDGKLVSAIGNIADIGGAFQDCTTVTSVVIPDGVTEIQDNAFYGCTALESVTVPASVTLLRNCAFCDCPNLRAVYFEGDAPQQANYVFDSTENVTMYYREGTSGWSNPRHGRLAETYTP